ncbi:MAG: succinate dehydrogenase cytochrome b subunit [bacterium]|nr:succinate dehydrogenase cytochrome b subunit [bacterium]
MLSWLARFLSSSIGKKVAMALSGLALIGFLIAHLAGNLTLYVDDDGTAFNAYAHKLESYGPLLIVAEIGLVALFLVHIGLALSVTRANREARDTRYQQRSSMGNKTAASSSMLITGLIVGVFLVIHIVNFKVPRMTGSGEDLAALVKTRLGSPLGASVYILGVAALGLHLSHAFKSALQTLGANHPKYNPLIQSLSLALAVLLFAGFVSFPLVLLLSGGGAS